LWVHPPGQSRSATCNIIRRGAYVETLESSISRFGKAIEAHMDQHPNLKEDVKLVETIKGLGLKTSYMLVYLISGGHRFGVV
jgi:hypothetical protein